MMAQTRNNDTGARNAWRENVAEGLRESAEHRRCPKCDRKGAITRTVEPKSGFVLRTCRYCDFEKGDYA